MPARPQERLSDEKLGLNLFDTLRKVLLSVVEILLFTITMVKITDEQYFPRFSG